MKTAVLVVLPAMSLCVACGAHRQSQVAAPQSRPEPRPVPLEPATPSSHSGVVHISEDIRKACGISEADAHFAFDSASLAAPERPVLAQLAGCFVSGALKGREMRLVGHADPRGSDDYNMVLGGSRADTVKAFLTMKGVPGQRIATTSRGELDARGSDEPSWAEDRRVDILLQQRYRALEGEHLEALTE